MLSYGARNAIALDGGGSAAMFFDGKMLVKPTRRLTNLLTLEVSPGAAWRPVGIPKTEQSGG
jgi:hypothetical protein